MRGVNLYRSSHVFLQGIMRKTILFCLILFGHLATPLTATKPTVYVDTKGVMRYSDNKAEASFFGVNYTLPFAHAYRAVNYLDLNHKEAINKDVYHFARLGFNAYRIHIWDVEIADSLGNLLENDHLDLLDYLIFKLNERDIKVVVTAMTNFGNGYPERNIDTGGFSYRYDKCEIHHHPEALKAQENYLTQLAKHINPYTSKAYVDDENIIAFEINNEPCHSAEPKQTTEYINRMVRALKNAGNKKLLFYNVSHNLDHVEAYYKSNIQGTTYQWYPTGLVAGKSRIGNFLPYVSDYNIPFKQVKGFANKAKMVYEYDPADNLYGYIHPAIVRSFRSAGFQWITQFAYDPIDMAQFNTEYQTHYLNLAYTPQKAISMKIAAEAARTLTLNKSYGIYPNDTIFGDFRVSYLQNLSELNSEEKFYYSNNTKTAVKNIHSLRSIAGYGNSPLVQYDGLGAYFLDRLEEGVWRLELMPDAVVVNDPFQKPSFRNEPVKIIWNRWDFTLKLPDFDGEFTIEGINQGNSYRANSEKGLIPQIQPGTYLLKKKGVTTRTNWNTGSSFGSIRLGEFVAPKSNLSTCDLVHKAQYSIEEGGVLEIHAQVFSQSIPDSVLVYQDNISFWNSHNPYHKMEKGTGYNYKVSLPVDTRFSRFRYNIVVYYGAESYTFPQGLAGMPLDWDFTDYAYYSTRVVNSTDPVILYTAGESTGFEAYMMPKWGRLSQATVASTPLKKAVNKIKFYLSDETPELFLQKEIKEILGNRGSKLQTSRYLCLTLPESPRFLEVGFVTDMGFTYKKEVEVEGVVVKVPLDELKQTKTVLIPQAYPEFMHKFFEPDSELPFDLRKAEKLEISMRGVKGEAGSVSIESIWIE